MTTPTLLVAKGWKLVMKADPATKKFRIALGHPELQNYSNILYDIQDLAQGIEVDIGAMMDVALGITQERSR